VRTIFGGETELKGGGDRAQQPGKHLKKNLTAKVGQLTLFAHGILTSQNPLLGLRGGGEDEEKGIKGKRRSNMQSKKTWRVGMVLDAMHLIEKKMYLQTRANLSRGRGWGGKNKSLGRGRGGHTTEDGIQRKKGVNEREEDNWLHTPC